MSDTAFIARVRHAIEDTNLRTALDKAESGFVTKRKKAIDNIGVEYFDAMRYKARTAKEEVLADLPEYLQQFEKAATLRGSKVHWADNGGQCNQIVLDILNRNNCHSVNKGKSMVAEETGLNHVLDQAGFHRTETDLGEYIIQLADEMPSHIIAPAVHKTRNEIRQLFRKHHDKLPPKRKLDTPAHLVNEARVQLRNEFIAADAGIIGSNALIANTGATMLVTNEGNGDLTVNLPRVVIVIAGIEKVVANMEDAFAILRVLARSATGQSLSTYTSFYNGPRSSKETDGPEQMHFILLDNGRSKMYQQGFAEMLRCIRCGACLNHCPVYTNIGGHAYGWVYPGPMGSVISPLLAGEKAYAELPNASTFCGKCEEICPMKIPLPSLMRKLRDNQFDNKLGKTISRWMVQIHNKIICRPGMYKKLTRFAIAMLGRYSSKGRLPKWLTPGPWRKSRICPAPQGKTFSQIAREASIDS